MLQRDLERGLKAHGPEGQVFLDQVDLGAGKSWVSQLEGSLGQSDSLVLMVTPGGLASRSMQQRPARAPKTRARSRTLPMN